MLFACRTQHVLPQSNSGLTAQPGCYHFLLLKSFARSKSAGNMQDFEKKNQKSAAAGSAVSVSVCGTPHELAAELMMARHGRLHRTCRSLAAATVGSFQKMANTRSCLSFFLHRPCQGSNFLVSPGLILFFLLVAVAVERPDAGLSTVDFTGKIPHGMWAASAAKRGKPKSLFVFALRGGIGAAAGEGETVAIHRPRAASGIADITKSVRIGGSMTNSSELAWSWGATVDDPGPGREHLHGAGIVGDANMTPSPRDGRARSRVAYPSGRRREPRTQTQIIQGASDGGDFIRRKLFLGGTGSLVERDLWDFLEEKFGEVEDVDVIRVNDRPRGFAFVTFTCSSAAAQCIGAGAFHLKGYMVNVLPSDKDAPVRRARAPKLPITSETQACNKVFLGGTRQLTESALLPMLQRFGDVSSLHVMSRPENMLQCAGYAFATMTSSEEARRLVNKGFITVANVTLEARFADEKSRPGISEKVSLFEVEELVASLRAEIARVTKYAPGGYRNHSPIQHEGIVFAAGTSFEHTLSQVIPACEEALDESGRSISQLHQLLEDAEMLRTQVYDCLASRVREAASSNDVDAVRRLVTEGACVNAPQRVLAKAVSDSAHTLGRYDELAPRCLYLAAAQGHVEVCGVWCLVSGVWCLVCACSRRHEMRVLFVTRHCPERSAG